MTLLIMFVVLEIGLLADFLILPEFLLCVGVLSAGLVGIAFVLPVYEDEEPTVTHVRKKFEHLVQLEVCILCLYCVCGS